jgi:hypothetical protein
MNDIDLIQIPGTCYSAIPVYSTSGELDEIAWFFYERVLPREKRIECLRDLFGLPVRFIEDILAELIRKNFALLDVANGMIIPVKEPKLKKEPRESAETKFWQDGLTGTVISLQTIPPLYLNRQGAHDIPYLHRPADGRHIPDFMDMPSTRIIAMLRMSSRQMVFHREFGNLDSIIARKKANPCPLFLPVRYAEIDGIPFRFLNAPELPELLIRHWSWELNRQTLCMSPILSLQTSFTGDTRSSFLDLCSLTAAMGKWTQSVQEVAEAESASQFHSKIRQYHSMRDSLLQMMDSLAELDLVVPKSGESHLGDMCARAETYIMVQTDRTEHSVAASLMTLLGSPLDWKTPFFLLEHLAATAELSEQAIKEQIEIYHRHFLSEPLGTGVCIIDSAEVRFGSVGDLFGNGLIFCLRGVAPVKQIAEMSAAYCNAQDTTWYLKSLIGNVMPDFMTAHLNKGFGEVFESSVSQDNNERTQNLVRLIEETDLLIKNNLPELRKKWEEFESNLSHDAKEQAQDDPMPPDIWGLIPKLSECVDRAKTWSIQKLNSRMKTAVHVGDSAVPLETLASILADLSGEDIHSVEIICDFVSRDSINEDVIRLLTKSLTWTELTLYLNPELSGKDHDPESVEALHAIQSIGHFRLTIVLGKIKIPPCMLVDSHFVIFGPRSWIQHEEHKPWLVATEAPHVAIRIRDLMKEAKPLL